MSAAAKLVNLSALESLLVRFSQLVIEQTAIAEIDINPLVASPDRLMALDARIVLHDAAKIAAIPQPAIRPYPTQYVARWTMKDGREVTVRPIRPEDEPLMVDFHSTLSDRTVYLPILCISELSARVAHERLVRICFGDYDREMVLVAEHDAQDGNRPRIVGVGRLNRLSIRNEAEVAVVVADDYQNLGLGSRLLGGVIQVARDEKISRVSSEMLGDDLGMQVVSKRLGFHLHTHSDGKSVAPSLEL